jgi:hypothetical protein
MQDSTPQKISSGIGTTPNRVYLDVETCGFHGVPVIVQYAINDGPIQIHEFWRTPMGVTQDLIRMFCENIVVGFNLAFDWFHIQKIYNIFEKYDAPDLIPLDYIDHISEYEMAARDGSCVKPFGALDLMLYAKKTDLQITMDRGDIRVRRVPSVLAWDLAKLLDKKITLDPILFAGRKKKFMPKFDVYDIKQSDGTIHPSLKDVVLKFRPSAALKAIAEHKLGVNTATRFEEIELDKRYYPEEYGYAPFWKAKGIKERGKRARHAGKTEKWPKVLQHHINHWAYNKLARQYAEDDIKYTRSLDALWNYPQHSDDDSILACSVASCRWKGYRLDDTKLRELIQQYKEKQKFPTAPNRVKEYLREVMNPIEWAASRLEITTKKAVLKDLADNWKDHEAGLRSKNVLDARAADKKVEVLEKLLSAGRFQPSLKIIGALSGRMSGADGLNPQGIDKTKEVRSCFPLAFDGEILLGGDMQSFEISIADADYNDPKLREALLTCERCNLQVTIDDRGKKKCMTCLHRQAGLEHPRCPTCNLPGDPRKEKNKKGEIEVKYYCYQCKGAETKSFHALFAMGFWPHMTYEEIMATKGTSNPIYNYAKNAAFATLYGAQAAKIAATLGLDEDAAQEGFLRFWRTFSVAGQKRKQVEYGFTSLYSSDTGGAIKRKKANDSIESLLGFRRFFTLENYLIGCLYEIANDPPAAWLKLRQKIVRSRRGEQLVGNALRSALYGSAFAVQNAIIRQAANHRIQSTGAGITKRVQVAIWDIQPAGISSWRVRPLNIHDEIQCPTDPVYAEEVERRVYAEVEKFRPLVPLIGIDFGRLNSWADK